MDPKTRMLRKDLIERGIIDSKILKAFETIPREEFLPSIRDPYADHPIPIGKGQTISQPYVVAFMLQELELKKKHTVLEIGSGSGYVIALLSTLVKKVVGCEIIKDLALRSKKTLENLKEKGIIKSNYMIVNSQKGYPDGGPYDRIIISAAAKKIPSWAFSQLKEGGIMILPLGGEEQWLIKVYKRQGSPIIEDLMLVRFVPLEE